MASFWQKDIGKLIKTYAGKGGTESLIVFVAETTGMLASCRALVQRGEAQDTDTL